MTNYETAFVEGEREAFLDRRFGRCRRRPNRQMTSFEEAWWDGYCPRNPAWATRTKPEPAWLEREAA